MESGTISNGDVKYVLLRQDDQKAYLLLLIGLPHNDQSTLLAIDELLEENVGVSITQWFIPLANRHELGKITVEPDSAELLFDKLTSTDGTTQSPMLLAQVTLDFDEKVYSA